MTEGNTIPSGKNLAGAAAEVSVIVAKTVGAINDYAQTASSASVKMMNSALRSSFMGSLAGMFRGLAQAGGEVFSAVASFKQGTNNMQKASEISALGKKSEASIAPLKAGQDEDYSNLQKHPKSIVGGGALSDGKMADDRSSLDYHSTQMKSVNAATEIEKGVIDSKYNGLDGGTQGYQALGRALGSIGNAFATLAKQTSDGVSGVYQNAATNTLKTLDGFHSTASQLLSMAGQLYVANTMVRG